MLQKNPLAFKTNDKESFCGYTVFFKLNMTYFGPTINDFIIGKKGVPECFNIHLKIIEYNVY